MLHVCDQGVEAGFLPGQRSGLHVHPVRVAPVPTRLGPQVTNQDILGYPSLFGDILDCSTRRFLSCRGSRIASCYRMNVAFLVYADMGVTRQCIKFVLLQLKVTVQIKGLSRRVAPFVAEAMEAAFLPALDKDQANMFTPSELRLY